MFNVGYRMLPTHPISVAVEDALSGCHWLRAAGYGERDIAVAGDSAGGYLAFLSALAVCGSDSPAPAGVVAICPFTDVDPARKLAAPQQATARSSRRTRSPCSRSASRRRRRD